MTATRVMVDPNGVVLMDPLCSSPEPLRRSMRRSLSSSGGAGSGLGSPSAAWTDPSGGSASSVRPRGGSRGASVRSGSEPAPDSVDVEACDPWDPRFPLHWWSEKGMTQTAPQSLQRASFADTAAGRHLTAPTRTFRDDEKARIWAEALRGNPAGPLSSETNSRISHRDPTGRVIPEKRLFQVSQGQLAALYKANATLGSERRAELLHRKPGRGDRNTESGETFRWFSPEEMGHSRSEPTLTNWGPTSTEPAPPEKGGRKFAQTDNMLLSWNPRQGTSWGVRRCGH